ncbi:hypothetical protein DF185_08170 [Marinifilum breve]|uniref:Uncharacterized protein n=1 Tax=Marinifilum breve TaxID=2184082 RepID=A0A2V3ZYV1_9BACT|nr:hypothetical protein [Marinifilum breve]PXY01451.1 hypothetical protein DF185_08170 [Marinifilum breve]
MNKNITARHNAFQQVQLTLNNNQAKFAHIPAMGKMFSSLTNLIGNTNELITKAGSIPSKPSGNKNLARTELLAVALKVSNILKVYSFVIKNENLNNFVNNVSNSYLQQMRNQEVLDYSKNLKDHISPIVTELADFGLTEELTAELSTEITDYEKVLTEPRQLISERKTTNELIEDNIDQIQSLISNQIDPMMELFIDDKEFYLSYKSARMIVDPATRKKAEETETTEQTE